MKSNKELDFMETQENIKGLAKIHYSYYECMKSLVNDKETAIRFTESFIESVQGGS